MRKRLGQLSAACAVVAVLGTAVAGALGAAPIAPPKREVTYRGGDNLAAAEFVAAQWGTTSHLPAVTGPASQVGTVGNFLDALMQSSWADLLSEYSASRTVNGVTVDETIGRGSYRPGPNGRPFVIAPNATYTPETTCNNPLNDTAIQAELAARMADGTLPPTAANKDRVYVVFTPQGLCVKFGASTSKANFCAYRNEFAATGKTIRYIVVPYDATTCTKVTPFDSMTMHLSRYVGETIAGGWGNNFGGIGLPCKLQSKRATLVKGRIYRVMPMWSEQQRKCAYDGPPRYVSVGDVSILEGDGETSTVQIPVSLSAPTPVVPITVTYSVAGLQDGSVTWDPTHVPADRKEVTKWITLKLTGDTVKEPDQKFAITIRPGNGYGLRRATGTLTILDDDATAGIGGVGDAATTAGNVGTGQMIIPVTLRNTLPTAVTVKYKITDHQAAKLYAATKSGAITVGPNMSLTAHLTVNVKTLAATPPTADKCFKVTLTPPSNVQLERKIGYGCIVVP